MSTLVRSVPVAPIKDHPALLRIFDKLTAAVALTAAEARAVYSVLAALALADQLIGDREIVPGEVRDDEVAAYLLGIAVAPIVTLRDSVERLVDSPAAPHHGVRVYTGEELGTGYRRTYVEVDGIPEFVGVIDYYGGAYWLRDRERGVETGLGRRQILGRSEKHLVALLVAEMHEMRHTAA